MNCINVFYLLAVILTLITGCNYSNDKPGSMNLIDTDEVLNCTYTIINTENDTYGYEIYMNDELFIIQKTIPGRQGTEGFKEKRMAQITAEFVTNKIKAGVVPPTVNKEELDSISSGYNFAFDKYD